jgi:hypothetical protein
MLAVEEGRLVLRQPSKARLFGEPTPISLKRKQRLFSNLGQAFTCASGL